MKEVLSSVGVFLRNSLLTGTLVLAPLGVTLWVFLALVSFSDRLIEILPPSIQPQQLLGFPVPGLGIVLTLCILSLVGMAMRYYAGRRIVQFYESLLKRLPIVSSLYIGLKQLLETIFARRGRKFSQAVLIEYPRRGIYCLAFITNDQSYIEGKDGFLSVFLPTTPNPTSGFFLLLEKSDVRYLDISIEEAFKLIMSAGLVSPELISLRPKFPQPLNAPLEAKE